MSACRLRENDLTLHEGSFRLNILDIRYICSTPDRVIVEIVRWHWPMKLRNYLGYPGATKGRVCRQICWGTVSQGIGNRAAGSPEIWKHIWLPQPSTIVVRFATLEGSGLAWSRAGKSEGEDSTTPFDDVLYQTGSFCFLEVMRVISSRSWILLITVLYLHRIFRIEGFRVMVPVE